MGGKSNFPSLIDQGSACWTCSTHPSLLRLNRGEAIIGVQIFRKSNRCLWRIEVRISCARHFRGFRLPEGTAASSVGSSRCRLGVIAYARCNGTVDGVAIAFKCLGRFNISHELNSFFDTPFQTPRSRRIILPCAAHDAVTTFYLFTAECATQVLWRSSLWWWLY